MLVLQLIRVSERGGGKFFEGEGVIWVMKSAEKDLGRYREVSWCGQVPFELLRYGY